MRPQFPFLIYTYSFGFVSTFFFSITTTHIVDTNAGKNYVMRNGGSTLHVQHFPLQTTSNDKDMESADSGEMEPVDESILSVT